MKQLRLTRPVYEQMIAQVQAVYPLEGCGILAGPPGMATQLYPVTNILDSRTAYEMEPTQQLAALLAAEAAGLVVVAFYHSHPDGPERPSPTDVAQAYYPEVAQVIVSLAERQRPLSRAFVVGNGRYQEIPLLVE